MVTKKIKLNVWENNYITLLANQGEVDSRNIEISFEDQNGELNLKNKNVAIYIEKPDKTRIFNNCEVNSQNNTAKVVITSQMVSVVGVLDCEFQIFDGQNTLLKVGGLKIAVSSDGDFSNAIQSSSEFDALIQAINEAKDFSGQADSANNAILDLSKKTQDISENLDASSAQIQILSAQMDNSSVQIQELSAKTDASSAQLQTISNNISGISTDIQNMSSELENVSAETQTLSGTTQSLSGTAQSLSNNIGSISSLETNDKTSLVGAVNELNSKVIPISLGGTAASTPQQARVNLEVMKATTLYDNSSGTNGTVTLIDSADNYLYLEIYYCSNDNDMLMCKICNPNNRYASLAATLIFNNIMYHKAGFLFVQGSSMTWLSTGFMSLPNGQAPSINVQAYLRVLKVLGYK